MRRASLVVVTRKVASAEAAARVADDVAVRARGVPTARVALLPGELRAWRGADGEEYRAPLETLRGASVLAVAAVGEPDAFFAQLRALGAAVEGAAYPDHHAFTAGDATALARRAATADRVLCTLKDAVKLGPVWPRLAPPLWYVSQRVAPEAGEGPLSALLEALLAARGVRPAR
jgi:tetraacyldisaccharide 4'-kinase